jgi:hypothetical protein
MSLQVTGQPLLRSVANTPAQTSVGAGAGQILAANANRRGMIIQNTGTTTIYLSLGGVNPTTTAYHFCLKACSGANDGSGGAYVDDVWTGAVQAIGSAGGGSVVITEISA